MVIIKHTHVMHYVPFNNMVTISHIYAPYVHLLVQHVIMILIVLHVKQLLLWLSIICVILIAMLLICTVIIIFVIILVLMGLILLILMSYVHNVQIFVINVQ